MLWIHCVYFGGGVLGREISAPHSPGELKKVTRGSDVCDMSTQDPQAFTVPPILGGCLGRGPLLVHSSSTARVGSSPSAAYGEGACLHRPRPPPPWGLLSDLPHVWLCEEALLAQPPHPPPLCPQVLWGMFSRGNAVRLVTFSVTAYLVGRVENPEVR